MPQTHAPLPAYALFVAAGDKPLRSSPGPEVVLGAAVAGPGARIELVARPETPIDGPVASAAYAGNDGELEVWDVSVEVSRQGAVRVAGSRDALLPPGEGEWTLVLVVGRPGRLPGTGEVRRALESGPPEGADWTIVATRLRVR